MLSHPWTDADVNGSLPPPTRSVSLSDQSWHTYGAHSSWWHSERNGGEGRTWTHRCTRRCTRTYVCAALSCIHMSCLHSVQAAGHGFLQPGPFSVVSVHAHTTMFSSLNNLASVLSHRVWLSPPRSCFCTEHCERVPRGLLLYRRPVTLIDFTLSHFLSRCHSLSYPHSHLLPIMGMSVCALGAAVLSLFFTYYDGKPYG